MLWDSAALQFRNLRQQKWGPNMTFGCRKFSGKCCLWRSEGGSGYPLKGKFLRLGILNPSLLMMRQDFLMAICLYCH